MRFTANILHLYSILLYLYGLLHISHYVDIKIKSNFTTE